jgi:formylglycine-generating enzyme required for sulfatase activity
MHPNSYIPGGDPNIDELLRQSFLDLDQNNPANDQLFDATSKDVFGKEWPGQVNAQKEAQLLKIKTITKWPWYLAGVIVTGIITTVAIISYNSPENKNSAVNENTITTTKNSPLTISNNNSNEKQENNNAQNDAYTKTIAANNVGGTHESQYLGNKLSNTVKNNSTLPLVLVDTTGKNTFVSPVAITTVVTTQSVIPSTPVTAVTYKVAEETKKQKNKMVTEATLQMELYYAHITGPSKSGFIGPAFATSFFLKTTEVTVREYQAFLNDLLMNNRKEDWEKARPKYEEMFGKSQDSTDKKFFDTYFSSTHYKNYPVVFVTPEAAEMYCTWLQTEIIKNSNGKFLKTEVRLPNESEWEKAALGDKPNAKYATTNGKIKHRFGGYEANFKSTQDNNFNFVNPEAAEEAELDTTTTPKKHSAGQNKNKFTCHVMEYGTNSKGLYNMSGNVSEMVYDKNRKVVTKGGNWNSPADYLQIKFDDEFPFGASASPYIGFRPVITFK